MNNQKKMTDALRSKIIADWVGGKTSKELSAIHGISRQAIHDDKQKNTWLWDVEENRIETVLIAKARRNAAGQGASHVPSIEFDAPEAKQAAENELWNLEELVKLLERRVKRL